MVDNNKHNTITLSRNLIDGYQIKINKDLIGVGKDYIIIELTEDNLMQLGKLAMDITSSCTVKELTLKL